MGRGEERRAPRRAEAAAYTVFITTDQNLRYQQNLSQFQLAFIILPSNQVPIVTALLGELRQRIASISAGDVIELPLPP